MHKNLLSDYLQQFIDFAAEHGATVNTAVDITRSYQRKCREGTFLNRNGFYQYVFTAMLRSGDIPIER